MEPRRERALVRRAAPVEVRPGARFPTPWSRVLGTLVLCGTLGLSSCQMLVTAFQ